MNNLKLPTMVTVVLLVLAIACNAANQPTGAMTTDPSVTVLTGGTENEQDQGETVNLDMTAECKTARLEAALLNTREKAREYEYLISVRQGVDQLDSSYDRLGEEQAWERMVIDAAKWIQYLVDTLPKRAEAVAHRDQVCGDLQLVKSVPLASDCSGRQNDAIESSPTLQRKMGHLQDRLTAESETLVEAINQKDGRPHSQHILKIAKTRVEMERLIREAHWESNIKRCSMQDYMDVMWAFLKLANDEGGALHMQLWQGEYPNGWPVRR